MRRVGLLAGVAVAVIASISLAIFSRFDGSRYSPKIQAEMEQRLGRKVSLGNLTLKLLPLRFRAESLSIADDPAFGEHALFLKADTVDLSVGLLPLLGHTVEVNAIELHRPRVEMVKNSRDVWNFSSIGHGSPQTPSSGAAGVVMKGNLILK